MNWRRGLLRLWVVTALCWLVVVACLASYESLLVPWLTAREQRACFDEHTSHPALGNPFDCFDKKAAIQPPPTATYAFVAMPSWELRRFWDRSCSGSRAWTRAGFKRS